MPRKKTKTDEELKNKAKIRHKRYREKHKDELREYKAKNAKKYYDDDPEKFRNRRMNYYYENRDKILKQNREREKTVSNEWHRNYRQRKKFWFLSTLTNRRLKTDDKISSWDLWKIAKKQKLICALTGDKLTNENLSIDHIIPTSKGGKNLSENIRLVTKEVNILKNSHSDEYLLELCKKVIKTITK